MKIIGIDCNRNYIVQMSEYELQALTTFSGGRPRIDYGRVVIGSHDGKLEPSPAINKLRELYRRKGEVLRAVNTLRACADLLEPIDTIIEEINAAENTQPATEEPAAE